MKQIGMVLVFFLLVGCTPVMVSSSDMLGGVRDGPRWGVVKYLNQGADVVIQGRRDSAKKMMTKFCSPNNYIVLGLREKSDIIIFNNAGGSYNYLYIRFQCVERKKLPEKGIRFL